MKDISKRNAKSYPAEAVIFTIQFYFINNSKVLLASLSLSAQFDVPNLERSKRKGLTVYLQRMLSLVVLSLLMLVVGAESTQVFVGVCYDRMSRCNLNSDWNPPDLQTCHDRYG